ncbi:hypothetical protein J2W17_004843 [Pseudomonas lini]|uniref:phytanoyl-CoA dioxygenase family protein n=1 Tax=Pseudomonas lini TaxID=163011 RepID=UPI002782BD8B|nr:phytanoyl-CoA dioxygenase family protein [Pseudomonas lini]MDQ0125873.1 hypothetical protein [Pseudomonas lini]
MSVLEKIISRFYPPKNLAFHLQRQVMRPSTRKKLAKLATNMLPALPKEISTGYTDEVNNLEQHGYVMLSDLVQQNQIEDILGHLSDKNVYDRWKPKAGHFNADVPPNDCHTALYDDIDVLNCPHALSWANDPRVLSIVGQALGAKPTLSSLAIWWSYPGHDTPQQAENFHRDVDDLHFIKLFIYLTDVDENCGPHNFVPGSQRHDGFRKIRRYEDHEVISTFGSEGIKIFTGAKGTSFLENTFGLHKGQLPSKNRRLLFQAQYSLHPIGIYTYNPLPRTRNDNLKPDQYINRLFIKS